MRRVQFQIPDDQYERLSARAAAAGESLATVLRRAVEVQDRTEEQSRRVEAARTMLRNVNYSSGLSDVSENHDEYFVQAIEERIGRR
jgi:Ribbon-helix-helix protein, copG family